MKLIQVCSNIHVQEKYNKTEIKLMSMSPIYKREEMQIVAKLTKLNKDGWFWSVVHNGGFQNTLGVGVTDSLLVKVIWNISAKEINPD